MQNYIAPGEHVTLPAPYNVVSGEAALIGSIFGVAQGAALSGVPVVWVRRGEFTLPKTEAQAWTLGAKIYWDATNKVCTTTASGNTLIGAALAVAANPSTDGQVLLDGTLR
ncbi:DUF2190 family protein [Cereibacter sphaeroides]|nr:DUF2190 family protein [Cereibacter sphaeroides]